MAQAQFFTRKMRLQNYADKLTRVVLSGNELEDRELRGEASALWEMNPFEFCTQSEYESSKFNSDYYFLRFVDTATSDSLYALRSLQLSKGGPADVQDIEAGFEIVRIPLGYVRDGEMQERSLCFLPAYIDMIQAYVPDAARSGRPPFTQIPHPRGKTFVFSERDLTAEAAEYEGFGSSDSNLLKMSDDDYLSVFKKGTEGAVVCIAIYPSAAIEGSDCYRLMAGADDHKLYYWEAFTLKEGTEVLFRLSDVVAAGR